MATEHEELDRQLLATGFNPLMIGKGVRIEVTDPNEGGENIVTYGKLSAVMVGTQDGDVIVEVALEDVAESEMICPVDHVKFGLISGTIRALTTKDGEK